MSNINSSTLEGRLTRPAELTYSNKGNPICNFSIANNESVKKPDGTWENRPSFFDCVIYGKYGQSMSQYLKKGRAVVVTGRLRQDRWEKDGNRYSRISIVVSELSLGPEASDKQHNYSEPAPVSDPMDFPPQEENPFEIPQ